MYQILAWLRRNKRDEDLFWDLHHDITQLLANDHLRELSIKDISRHLLFWRWQIEPVVEQLLTEGTLGKRYHEVRRVSVYYLTAAGFELAKPAAPEPTEIEPHGTAPTTSEIANRSEDQPSGPDLKFLQAPTTLAFAWTERGTYAGEKEVVAWGIQFHAGGFEILVTDIKGRALGTFLDVAQVLAALETESPDEFGRRLITVYVGQPAQELPAKLRTRRDAPQEIQSPEST